MLRTIVLEQYQPMIVCWLEIFNYKHFVSLDPTCRDFPIMWLELRCLFAQKKLGLFSELKAHMIIKKKFKPWEKQNKTNLPFTTLAYVC